MSAFAFAGFWHSEPVRQALLLGGAAAGVSAVVGVFAVMRGHAFAGHMLADVSSAGGAASFLLGLNPLAGFLLMAGAGALGVELVGASRVRERDLVTGVALGAGLGLTALLLYFDVTLTSTTGAAITVMFGSMFAIPASIVVPMLAVAAVALTVTAALYRPLLLCAIDPELAAARGVSVRFTGLAQMLVLASAVSLSAMTVGAILSTALLVGPAAIALRVARRPAQALAFAVAIGVGVTWISIALAYGSYYWTPGHGWPVSFFVAALVFALYLLSKPVARRRTMAGDAAPR